MIEKTVYLERINAKAPVENVLYRMGYKKGKTLLPPEQQNNIYDAIKTGEMLCDLKGAYLFLKITSKNGSRVTLENGAVIESGQVAGLFKTSSEVLLMAATTGSGIIERRNKEMKAGNNSVGVILDAVGSETADTGLDWIQEFLQIQLLKKGRVITRRFSPGYGDLKLECQKTIYDALDLSKIGISISDRFLLTPEKSVIAVAGVS
jgi:hypothetical protein